jgi:alkylation response protein AidB-like acyl-CoA dehydrogenase
LVIDLSQGFFLGKERGDPMTTGATASVLTDDLLARCLERAPGYDKENKFFQEDFDELKAAGYLNIAVPKELGGGGLTLAEAYRRTAAAVDTNEVG